MRLPTIVDAGLATIAVAASGLDLVVSSVAESQQERATGGGGRYGDVWRPEFYEPFRRRRARSR